MNPIEHSDALISKRLNEAELETFELLVPRHKKSAIDMADFSDFYGKETVKADQTEVNRLQKIFDADQGKKSPEETDNTKRGKILEALLAERIELDNWLGQEAETIVPSIFDDYKHGVDLLVEFQGEGGFKHLALSIDATTNTLSIIDKIEKIKSGLIFGRMTSVKYFHSEEAGIRGSLEKIPKVVIGASIGTIKELCFLWVSAQKSKKEAAKLEKELGLTGKNDEAVKSMRAKAKESLAKLATHNIQFLILEEIKIQLEGFSKYAQKIGRQDVEDKYKKALAIVLGLIEEKKEELGLSEETVSFIQRDPIYKSIVKEISNL